MATNRAGDKPKIVVIPKPQVIPKVINGGTAGMVGVSVVFPLDLVKTRLQNQVVGPKGEKQYTSMLDCFKKTYSQEGFWGMYRGVKVAIVFITPDKAIKLASNDMFRYYLTLPDGSLPVARQTLAGGAAGAVSLISTTPMDLLKIQLQDAGRVAAQNKTAGKEFRHQSGTELFRKLIAERGFFGLYKGLFPTFWREVVFSCFYFPLFSFFSSLGPKAPGKETPPFWCSFLSGIGAGAIAAWVSTPMDVVKTRMQTLTKGKGERPYKGFVDAVTSVMKHEGITAYFKGGACRMVVIAPLYGIAQVIYFIGIGEWLLGIKK